MAELKTRIILRNGTTAEWEKSTVLLKEGEIALEYCEDGTVKQKAGVTNSDGTGTLFSALPYIGSDVKEAGIYEITYEFGDSQPIDIDDVAAAAAGEGADTEKGGKQIPQDPGIHRKHSFLILPIISHFRGDCNCECPGKHFPGRNVIYSINGILPESWGQNSN